MTIVNFQPDEATEARRASLRTELRAGWRAVSGAVLGLATGLPLYLYTNGFFVRPLAEEFHWTRGEIGFGAAAGLLGIVTTPLAGWLADRIGVRLVAAFGFGALALGYLMLSQLNGELHLFYSCLITMHALAPAATATVLTRPIAQAFTANRGVALGIGAGASALLIMVIAPALQAVITAEGWRTGFRVLACLSGLLGLGGVVLLPPARRTSQSTSRGGGLLDALKERRFWLMFAAMLFANICFGGLLNQLPALLADRGFAPLAIGFGMSMLTGAAAAGRLLEGLAIDRLQPSVIAFCSLLLPIVGLLFLREAHGATAASASIALIGVGLGAEGTMLGFLIARFFDLKAYGAVFGALSIPINVALAIGGGLFGAAYDRTGSYDAAIAIASGGLGVAALCMLATRFVPRKRL